MRVLENPFLTNFEKTELVATCLGYQIFLKRVFVQGADRGLWLHWCHPRDQGKKHAPKYGHFLPSIESLPQALTLVRSMIETMVELELTGESSEQSAFADWNAISTNNLVGVAS